MWRDLYVEEDHQMVGRARRFLAFIDFLGTRELYTDPEKNAPLLEDRRYELEHAVHILLQDVLATKQIEIGLFSDTVLVAGGVASIVVSCASRLFAFSFEKTIARDSPTDIRLLRGGVSEGIELRSSYLRSSGSVHVIPFFDGSLAFAYELEGIRRGSRLFLDNKTFTALDSRMQRFVFQWNQAPGFGRPLAGFKEFLWPAMICADRSVSLSNMLHDAFIFWRKAIIAHEPSPESYRETLYHWDETLKTVIRSFTASSSDTGEALVTLLPSDRDRMRDCNIRYLWGIWFQALLVMRILGLDKLFAGQIELTMSELKDRGYYDKFLAETHYPDYAPLRELLQSLQQN
jgi:hypothetical protein